MIVSYMGKIRFSVVAEDVFIDSHKLKSCIQKAIEMILNATRRASTNFLNGHESFPYN